ncbi:MAG: ribonuclease HII [Pseudomonadota bacterium]
MIPNSLIAGIDEAGRGCWAGAVYAAAVILPDTPTIAGLRDSKKLSANQRQRLAVEIREKATAWAVATASAEEIDALNILRASLEAMRRAAEALRPAPKECWVDGLHVPKLKCPAKAFVRGDSLHPSIMAASILAKVARDRDMIEQERAFPGYGFAKHKGYGTEVHRDALEKLGPCAIHRRSFAPVARLLP